MYVLIEKSIIRFSRVAGNCKSLAASDFQFNGRRGISRKFYWIRRNALIDIETNSILLGSTDGRKCATSGTRSIRRILWAFEGELNGRRFETGTEITFCSGSRGASSPDAWLFDVYIAIIGSAVRSLRWTNASARVAPLQIDIAKIFPPFSLFRKYLVRRYRIYV